MGIGASYFQWNKEHQSTPVISPDSETMRRQLLEAVEKRLQNAENCGIQNSENCGIKDFDRVRRMQQKAVEKDRLQEEAVGRYGASDKSLRWQMK